MQFSRGLRYYHSHYNCNIYMDTTPVRVQFEYGNGLKGIFHVKETKGGRYQWFARGNCGEESTMTEAIKAAREWIQFDKIKKETD